MSYSDDYADRKEAINLTCGAKGHDWSHSADSRSCRRCGASSHYGSNACHNGHDWANSPDLSVCRRCSARLSYCDIQRIRGY
jgi:rubredoxin